MCTAAPRYAGLGGCTQGNHCPRAVCALVNANCAVRDFTEQWSGRQASTRPPACFPEAADTWTRSIHPCPAHASGALERTTGIGAFPWDSGAGPHEPCTSAVPAGSTAGMGTGGPARCGLHTTGTEGTSLVPRGSAPPCEMPAAQAEPPVPPSPQPRSNARLFRQRRAQTIAVCAEVSRCIQSSMSSLCQHYTIIS